MIIVDNKLYLISIISSVSDVQEQLVYVDLLQFLFYGRAVVGAYD